MSNSLPYNYIAIEGNIGAGKTTLSKMLAEQINGKLILEKFDENPFLPHFYKDPERYAFPVELFFLTERQKQLHDILLKPDLFYEYFVSDYVFIKTLLFAKNNLKDEEYKLFKRIYEVVSTTFPKPDLVLYLHRPVDVLLKNIEKRGRAYEQEISDAYLLGVQNAYFEYFKLEQSHPTLILNIGTNDFSMGSETFVKLIELVSRPYKNGMHILNFV